MPVPHKCGRCDTTLYKSQIRRGKSPHIWENGCQVQIADIGIEAEDRSTDILAEVASISIVQEIHTVLEAVAALQPIHIVAILPGVLGDRLRIVVRGADRGRGEGRGTGPGGGRTVESGKLQRTDLRDVIR